MTFYCVKSLESLERFHKHDIFINHISNSKFLGDLLYWEVLISFLGEGGLAIFFHKGINDQSCNWWQLMARLSSSCVHANFPHFYFGIFSLRIFCLFKCPLKLSKKWLLLLGINSVKVWIQFDMSSKEVNIVW